MADEKWVKVAAGGYRRLEAYNLLRAENFAGVGWSISDGVTANRFDVVYANQTEAEDAVTEIVRSLGVLDLD